ncbi:MAG: hypothetical protein HOQ22_11725 [Nocardioidaceae bacterium]|nr:hypothetical protein [Nocardioidaceae bacterium]
MSAWGRRAVVTALVVSGINMLPVVAEASSVTSAVFSGGAGTATVGGTLYAKQGAGLTLTVVTASDTQCVQVTGAATLPRQTSSSGKSSWTFTTTAAGGDGAQAFTVVASEKFNANNCTGSSSSTQASYTRDNTGPLVSATLTPAANPDGWNNSNVDVAWTATDAGSGVAGAQPFTTESVTKNGVANLSAAAQADRVGNTGSAGAVTVRVDKAAPGIVAAQTPNPDGTTTITFTCSDSGSGSVDSSGIASCLADGSASNARTVQPGVTVTGTATDRAGNTATASSTAPGDATPPTLAGAPATQPNGAGWYHGDVAVHWVAADPQSGIPTAPADTTITGEGTGLTSTQTVRNGAGLATTATSSPAVKIDRTAPTTAISGTSNDWVGGDVRVTLTATDNLSTVESTTYRVDGGPAQAGTSFTLADEGEHTITYASTDKAGNVEQTRTAHVRIDKTAPTISHGFAPSTYTDGAWTNQDVTVTFTCADQGGSGVASCTAPVTKSAETGTDGDAVTGTATDGAGNQATDTATVRIDKTKPTITARPDRDANVDGWYDDDVTVTYVAGDALSGISSGPEADVLGEGENQSAGATVTDAAGNSASAGVTGINVDKTAPTLEGSFPAGWHTDDVVVSWTCTDALSGPAGQPADTTVTGEGGTLAATASCADRAGNTVARTVTGIKIDRTAPTTTASVPDPNEAGWHHDAVTVTLDANDNLSGIDTTYYAVDGQPTKVYDGPVRIGDDGEHSISFWSKDDAGNVETAGAPVLVSVDTTAPETSVTNPISTATGWFVRSGIPFAFDASDATSGIAATYYTIDGGDRQTYGKPFTRDLSDGLHTVVYWSVDLAGNQERHGEFDINVDTTAPSITGSQSPAANGFGWNNTDVAVSFECSDTLSGIESGVAGCAGDTTLTNEGADQTVNGDAVDVAGNTSSTAYGPVNIDKTAPTLTGRPEAANAAGWHAGDVTVAWVGDDGLSGIDPDTRPSDSTVTGEGRGLGARASVVDKAGNVGHGSVTGIDIDRHGPTASGAATTKPNVAGWYRDAVTVHWDCTDPQLADRTEGSGVASCSDDKVLSKDGADQSVSSDAPVDLAGNVGTTDEVGGIDIDGTAPVSTAAVVCTIVSDWCTGDTATVTLSAGDQSGLSGVREIHAVVDGQETVTAGPLTSVAVPLTGSGAATVRYWAVDNAGNVEPAHEASLKWDNVAPVVTHTVSPGPNADGWNRDDVTVHFDATDEHGGSGVADVSTDSTVSDETAGRQVTGVAHDKAGNQGSDSVTVKLDRTAPGIAGSRSGKVGDNGWYTGPVTVHFDCSDALSGVAACTPGQTVSANGVGQSVSGEAVDRAGNRAGTSVSGINVDAEGPTIAKVNVQGNTYVLGTVPTATCTATDNVSGVASCKVTVTGGNANGVGAFAYTATATDQAGNTTKVQGGYQVIYRFDGFLQPINDTAHQVGASTSIFKAGSTVPAKIQLKKADGTVVQSTSTPAWLTPVKGSATSAPVDESAYTMSADSGSDYRYDSGQWVYNWKTPSTGGSYYRIGVAFDDGQTYYVNIGLR